MLSRAPSARLRRRGVALVALALAAPLAGCGGGSSPSSASTSAAATDSTGASGFDGAALPAGVGTPNFTLSDQDGQRVSLASYRGQVVIVAFVYSTCGSACVVIAQQVRGALDELAKPVPVLLISADPAADTPTRVSHFLAQTSLSGRVRYLSGTPAELRPIWRAFRIVPASSGRTAFERTAAVVLLDGAGRQRVIFQLEQLTPEALSHDVRKLLG
jgi:protein SCO1/2